VISISLIFLGPHPLTHLSLPPLSVHDFVDGLLELSVQQVSFIRNSLNRQLDIVFGLDPSEVTVSRIDPLVVPEDRYHFTLEQFVFPALIPSLLYFLRLKEVAFVNVTLINLTT